MIKNLNVAKTGRDVLFFSLEMSRVELVLKSISRQTFMADNSEH
jgi:replicative DNA helicase